MTPEYVYCHQYIRGSELLDETTRQLESIEDTDRRRQKRVEGHWHLSISACTEEGEPGALIDDMAIALDISLGGMRIESSQGLPEQGVIQFSFADDFADTTLSGLGQVRWRRMIEEPSLHQYGLCFSSVDETMKHIIEHKLGLQAA